MDVVFSNFIYVLASRTRCLYKFGKVYLNVCYKDILLGDQHEHVVEYDIYLDILLMISFCVIKY